MADRNNFYDRLLKFCVSTAPGGQSVPRLMSREDSEWLSEAMDDLVTSPMQIVRVCVAALERQSDNKTDEEAEEIRLQAMITLNEWLEDIDVSQGFLSLNKGDLIERLLCEPDERIRLEACRLVSSVTQNYEHAQNMLCNETSLMDILAGAIRDDPSLHVKSKALSALRCLVENNIEQSTKLMKSEFNIYEIIKSCLQYGDRDIEAKTGMLMKGLIEGREDDFIRSGFDEILLQSYAKGTWHQQKYTLLECLHLLVKSNPSILAGCSRDEFLSQIAAATATKPKDEDSSNDDEIANRISNLIAKA